MAPDMRDPVWDSAYAPARSESGDTLPLAATPAIAAMAGAPT